MTCEVRWRGKNLLVHEEMNAEMLIPGIYQSWKRETSSFSINRGLMNNSLFMQGIMPQQACMRSTFIARINFDDTVLSQNKGLPFIYIFKEQETILYTTSEYILRTYMDTVCIHTCVCMYL